MMVYNVFKVTTSTDQSLQEFSDSLKQALELEDLKASIFCSEEPEDYHNYNLGFSKYVAPFLDREG